MPQRPTSTKANATLVARIRQLIAAALVATTIAVLGLNVLAIGAQRAGASTVPAAVDHWSHVSQFGSYGDLTTNDCAIAAIGDLQQAWNASIGGAGTALAEAPISTTYLSIAHGEDTGVLPGQAFAAWKQGIDGMAIDSVGTIATSQASVEHAVWQLGGIFAVVNITGNDTQHTNLPTAATAAIAPWSLKEQAIPGAFSAVPHAVAVVGYNRQYVYLTTWGSVQPVTWSWWNARVIQAWPLLPHAYSSVGHGPVSTVNSLNQTFFMGSTVTQSGPYSN